MSDTEVRAINTRVEEIEGKWYVTVTVGREYHLYHQGPPKKMNRRTWTREQAEQLAIRVHEAGKIDKKYWKADEFRDKKKRTRTLKATVLASNARLAARQAARAA